MKIISDEAVSPVIGILLMLVVTIIIAAIVSGFAGGLTSEQSKTPQVSLSPKVVIQNISGTKTSGGMGKPGVFEYPSDYTAKNGIQFEHKGGDPISLDQISISLESQGVSMIVSGTDKYNQSMTCLPKGATDGTYFVKIASDVSDKIIEPGDKFMFYADNCYLSKGDKLLAWNLPSGKMGYGVIGANLKYEIADKQSSKPMGSGTILLK